jgi:hypothetical protein
MARSLYPKLVSRTGDGFFLLSDDAFLSQADLSRILGGRIHKPLSRNHQWPAEMPDHERQEILSTNRQLVQARQAVGWGQRAIQGSFSRLKIPLPITSASFRWAVLECIARLHQVRVGMVGRNQIQTVYMRAWEEYGLEAFAQFGDMMFRDIRAHDRLARYYNIH